MTRRLFLLAAALFVATPLLAAPSWNRQVVAAVLVLEADVDGEAGMIAVMNVIQNRASGFSETAYVKVVTKPKQFSCLNRKGHATAVRTASRHDSWSLALSIVDRACSDTLPDTTGGATHYERRGTQAYWAKDMEQVAEIGSHVFYK
jgi:N-acetylmuramoyl-L-alanine amidase